MSLSGLKLDETDDEFFGSLESRSNLANLFGVNQPSEGSNQSLKYKPPKQVQAPVEVGEATQVAWIVVVAKVVTAFKLVNQENIPQGKLGLALLNTPQNSFKLILYRTKTSVLATATLQPGVSLILKSSYLQFHDDTQQFWSVFLDPSDEKSFVDHVPAGFLTKVKDPKPAPTPTASKDSSSQSMPSKDSRPSSDAVTDDSDTTSKAKLLTRMAKMGQPLPKLAAPQTTTDPSDSSDTEVVTIPPKPIVVPRKVSKQLVPVANVLPAAAYSQQIQENQYMNMLLTENRTQNTEIRMNLSKLETKIEKVLDTIVSIGSHESGQKSTTDKDSEIIELEEKVIELRRENRSLRQNMRELNAKKTASPEPALRAEKFTDFEDILGDLGVFVEDCKDLEDLAVGVLTNSRTKLELLRGEVKKNEGKLKDSRTEVAKLKAEIAELETKQEGTEKLQENVQTLVKEKEELSKLLDSVETTSKDKLQTLVKQIMNNLYGGIVTSLETATEPLTKEMIMRICGSAIRQETMNAIQGNT